MVLYPTEIRYTLIEKVCLSLYFACTKLRQYLIKSRVYVVSQTNLKKYMLNRPLIIGRLGKWFLALSEFTLTYFPHKLVKGQALVGSIKCEARNLWSRKEALDPQIRWFKHKEFNWYRNSYYFTKGRKDCIIFKSGL